MKIRIKKLSKIQLMIFIVVGVLLLQDGLVYITKIAVVNNFDEFLVLIGIFVLFYKYLKRGLNKSEGRLVLCILGFIFCGIFSLMINSKVHITNMIGATFLASKCMLFILACYSGFSDDRIFDYTKKAIDNWGMICVIVAMLQIIFPTIMKKIIVWSSEGERAGSNYISSFFGYPAKYGWFMLFCACMMAGELVQGKTDRKIIKFLVYVLFSLFSMRSKTMVAAVVIVCIVFKKVGIPKKYLLVLIGAGTFLFGALYVMRDTLIWQISIYLLGDEYDSARSALTKTAVKIAKDYFPLGAGFGKYGTYYSKLDYSEFYIRYHINSVYGMSKSFSAYITDTMWPAILGETGYLGLGCYISFLFFVLKNIYQNYRQEQTGMYFAALLILLQALIETLGNQIFNTAPAYIAIAFVLGTAMKKRRHTNV